MGTPSANPVAGAPAGWRTRAGGMALVGLGAFCALGVVGALAAFSGQAWVLGSFGASCVLLFGYPAGPFSRPRNVIGGHFLASLVGLLALQLLGPGWLSMAVAGASATVLMLATDTVHPPAGSNPVIVQLTQPGWDFLLLPTLLGACALVLVAHLYAHGLERVRQRRPGGA